MSKWDNVIDVEKLSKVKDSYFRWKYSLILLTIMWAKKSKCELTDKHAIVEDKEENQVV